MTWDVLNTEPAYSVCDQCKKHDCGIVETTDEAGNTVREHKWIRTGIYDRSGDAIVIGYQCVELWANNLGISRVEIEKPYRTPPTQEEIGEYLRALLSTQAEDDPEGNSDDHPPEGEQENHDRYTKDHKLMPSAEPGSVIEIPGDRDGLRAWLQERNISFFNGATEGALRKMVMDHVTEQGYSV